MRYQHRGRAARRWFWLRAFLEPAGGGFRWRPVSIVLADRDYRIEKPADGLDDAHQPLNVCVGWIALVRRWLDEGHRQRSHQQRLAAKWIVVRAENGAAVALDLCGELADSFSGDVFDFCRSKPDRCWSSLLPTNRLLARGHVAGDLSEDCLSPGRGRERGLYALVVALVDHLDRLADLQELQRVSVVVDIRDRLAGELDDDVAFLQPRLFRGPSADRRRPAAGPLRPTCSRESFR